MRRDEGRRGKEPKPEYTPPYSCAGTARRRKGRRAEGRRGKGEGRREEGGGGRGERGGRQDGGEREVRQGGEALPL